MKLKIYGEPPCLYQWDLGRKLIVEDDGSCSQVHFCNGIGDALSCSIRDEGDGRVVDIPNILLQKAKPITAYLYIEGADGSRTRSSHRFFVFARPKPADYVYTETEAKTWDALSERLDKLEKTDTVKPDWVATKTERSGDTLYIPEQTLSSGSWSNLQTNLEPGSAYDVYINGEVYSCECRDDGDGAIYLGNGALIGDTKNPNNNEPFCITWAGGSATGGMFKKDSTLSYPLTLKVTNGPYYVYNQMPKEYLPNCVVKGDENGVLNWNKISDKPFTQDVGELLFSYIATFATDAAAASGVRVAGVSFSLVSGAEYWLDVNGDLIRCRCINTSGIFELYDSAGNKWLKHLAAFNYVYGQMAGTFAYKLYGLSENVVLDPQRIPGNVARKQDIPDKASAVADAAGETVTSAEFNALLTALREAGYLST